MSEFPAPWTLDGEGYIIVYHFPKAFVSRHGFIPQYLDDRFAGGFGTVMLVNYHNSPVGPYHELLFIPGQFELAGAKRYSITKIYVSSTESVVNGQANWGIPKELATFSVEQDDDHTETIRVMQGDERILAVRVNTGRLPFPINTDLIRSPLIQQGKDGLLVTKLTGRGRGRRAHVMELQTNDPMFPPIQQFQPLAAVRVDKFRLVFPIAERVNPAD